jgi:hypothetical protein
MKSISTLFILMIMLSSCEKKDNKTKPNAVIIKFHAEKCMCCWGWDAVMGNDTIRIDDGMVGEKVGFLIDKPVPVYIELGEKEETCSSNSKNMDFYKVIRIEMVNY